MFEALSLSLLALYFIPGIIALLRAHHNKIAIFVLNLLLGWTLLGWVVALVWSFTAPQQNGAPVERKPTAFAQSKALDAVGYVVIGFMALALMAGGLTWLSGGA